MAQNPEAGDLIPGASGLRKLRWPAKGKGKLGGCRVIYYFRSVDVPVFLMAIFAKNVQPDLTGGQRAALARRLRALRKDWQRRRLR